MGTKPDGTDSLAEQIAAAEHWPEMRILILVVNAHFRVSPVDGTVRTMKYVLQMQFMVVSVIFYQANTGKKHTGSTSGMQTSVETSELLQERIKQVPRRMELMTKAILQKDYQLFAELTMKVRNLVFLIPIIKKKCGEKM